MNDFVEQCRREWKRLRVPEPVANEMASDLTADLKEAEAECVALLRWKSLGSTSVLKDLVSSMTIDRRWKNSPKSTKFTQRQNYLCLLCLFWLFTLCAKWNPPLEMIGRIG